MTVTFRPIPAGRFLRDVLVTKLDLQTFQTNCGDLLESEGNEALSMDVVPPWRSRMRWLLRF